MQTGKPQIKQGQMAVSDTHKSSFFGEVISRHGVIPDP